MITQEAVGTSSATPEDIWAVLGNYFGLSSWATGINHSSPLTATPAGPGAVRRVQVGASVLIETVTTWEPKHAMTYTIAGLPPLALHVENRWRLTPRPDRGTDISLELAIEPVPRPIARLLVRAMQRRMASANRGLVNDLVAAVAAARKTTSESGKETPW